MFLKTLFCRHQYILKTKFYSGILTGLIIYKCDKCGKEIYRSTN